MFFLFPSYPYNRTQKGLFWLFSHIDLLNPQTKIPWTDPVSFIYQSQLYIITFRHHLYQG